MKLVLSILAMSLFASCNSSISSKEEKTEEKKDGTTVTTPDTAVTKNADTTLLPDVVARVGNLQLGMMDTKVIELIGQPEKKSKEVEWGADGLMHQDWEYKSKGITLDMSRDKAAQQISSITVVAPSDLKTTNNLGIGSDYKDVLAAYEKDIDKEMSDESSIVVGSVYGGLIFNFKDKKVVRVFVGAAAE